MHVDLLGPLEITDVDPNAPLPPGALMAKERALLETLALRAPGRVPRVDLERALWGESPPPTARKTLASHVSRLRRALGDDVSAGGGGGYRLALPRESVDVHLLEALVAAGADALDREAPAQARERFGAAESLWRGEPLADVADSVERQAQVERLHRLIDEARAGRLRAELALGRHAEVLPELQRLVAQDALAEQVCGLLMLALFRTGRQVEALRAFHRLRAGLAEEWGVDPSAWALLDAAATPAVSTRYRLLYVMREHAGAQLAATGESDAAHQALADTMRALAVEAGPHLDGARPGPWLRRLQSDLPALRAAVRWSMEHDPPVRTLEFAHSVGRIMWSASVDLRTDTELLRGLLERAPDAPADVAGWGWQELVTASYLAGDLPLALHACDRAEDLFTQAGDRVGLAVTCWHRGAALMLAAGDLAAAETTLRRGITLARQSGAATPEAWNTTHVVQLLYLRGDLTREIDSLMARAEALADPEDGQLRGHLAMNRGFVAMLRGDLAAGAGLCRTAEATGRRFGVPAFEQAGLLGLGHAQLRSHEREAARATSLRAAQLALDTGNEMQLGLAQQLLATLSDDPVVAARLWGAAQARAPQFPAFTDSLDMGWARDALDGRFAPLVASGHDLSPRAAMARAVA